MIELLILLIGLPAGVASCVELYQRHQRAQRENEKENLDIVLI